MSKGSLALLSLFVAAALPGAANAKSFDTFDLGFGYSEAERRAADRTYTNRRNDEDRGYRAAGRDYGNTYGTSRRAGRGYGQTAYGYVPKTWPKARGTRQAYATPQQGVAMANRGIANNSGPSPGTSTMCLTAAAQDLLGKIQTKFGKVEIVSTCRPGSTIAGTGYPSKHASGEAIDFRVPGKKAEVVQWLIANDRMGGIMTYSDMDHIHVDVGARFVALNRPSGRT